jgi:hypothetical protein
MMDLDTDLPKDLGLSRSSVGEQSESITLLQEEPIPDTSLGIGQPKDSELHSKRIAVLPESSSAVGEQSEAIGLHQESPIPDTSPDNDQPKDSELPPDPDAVLPESSSAVGEQSEVIGPHQESPIPDTSPDTDQPKDSELPSDPDAVLPESSSAVGEQSEVIGPHQESSSPGDVFDPDPFPYEFGVSISLESEVAALDREGQLVDALIVEEDRRHDELLDDLARQRHTAETAAMEGEAELDRLRVAADAASDQRAAHCRRAIALIDRAAEQGPVVPRVVEERRRLQAELVSAAAEREACVEATRLAIAERVAAGSAARARTEEAMRASEAELSALADRRERLRRRHAAASLAWVDARRRDAEV